MYSYTTARALQDQRYRSKGNHRSPGWISRIRRRATLIRPGATQRPALANVHEVRRAR